jgi:NAD(P)-dependent dehydrogenase (short-subunit alcohol dehydrogenase family)
LITGAGQGIGRACAEVLALKGADVVLLDKNSKTLSATAKKIKAIGRQAFTRTLDLTDIQALQKAVEEAKQEGRMGEPAEIANVVAFLVSGEASFITAAAIPVSGGWGI